MQNLFTGLDTIAERFWSRVLSLLCGLTGRNNFFFARLFARLGGGCVVFLELLLASYDLESSAFWGIWDLASAVGFAWLALTVIRITKRFEKGFESGGALSAANLKDMTFMYRMRAFGTIFILIGFLVGAWFPNLFIGMLVGGIYFALDFRPKTKSKTRQVVEAAATKAGELHLPVPAPAPSPTPS